MSFEDIRNERIKKLAILKDAGVDPYPIETHPTHTLAEVAADFEEISGSGAEVVLVGRVMSKRGHGGIMFADFVDGSGATLQAYCKEDEMGDSLMLLGETLDVGDFVEWTGKLALTKRGERSVEVSSWRMLAKSLRPLPDKWHGLQDVEERFRRRYLDTLMAPEVRERFVVRARIISALRAFLDKAGFLEVDTPVLQAQAGGATAEPFRTHHNALDIDMYLRISDELYLKRLLVGGFPKVYEIARDFRNEGIDVTHNPEFSMVEWYEAYSNAAEQRGMVERLMRHIVETVFGKLAITHDEQEIDFAPQFAVISYSDLLKKYALISDLENIPIEELRLKAKQLGATVAPADGRWKIVDHIYKKSCRPKLIAPTFIIDYPVDYLPLAKRNPAKPGTVDAFQLVVGGYEIVKAFSELNDPLDQRERFKKEDAAKTAGDKEAQETDEDFLEALEYGMPPAGGVGIGIDRLVMLLTDTKNIREVILFPTLKPKQ